jgi:hypothetical protein
MGPQRADCVPRTVLVCAGQYLCVKAAQKFQIAIGSVLDEIPGAIDSGAAHVGEPRTVRERVRNESFFGLVGEVDIAPGNTTPTDEQFARDP